MEDFGNQLEKCNPKIRFYKSKANIFLGEILDKEKNAEDLMYYMLIAHGIYIRDCGDKKGLNENENALKMFKLLCSLKLLYFILISLNNELFIIFMIYIFMLVQMQVLI